MTQLKSVFSIILGIVISGGAFYFALRNVPAAELWQTMLNVDLAWIIPSVGVVVASFFLRTLRWQLLLKSAGRIDFFRVYHPLIIGFMLNCILPGRLGEVARPVLLQKEAHVAFSTGLATVVAERIFDILCLMILFAVMLFNADIDPQVDIAFGGFHLNRELLMHLFQGMIILSMVLITGMILVSLKRTRRLMQRVILYLPSILIGARPTFRETLTRVICIPLNRFIDNFAAGTALLKRPRDIGLLCVLSLLIWLMYAGAYYLSSLGCPDIGLSFANITTTMVIICVFISLPSVPGFWGIWEAAGVFALALFGVPAGPAAAFTLINHAVQILPVIIMGLISTLATGAKIFELSKQTATMEKRS